MSSSNISQFTNSDWPPPDDESAPAAMTSKHNATRTWDRIKYMLDKVGLLLLIFLAVSLCVGGLIYIISHISVRPSIKILSMSVSPIDLSADNSQITANWTIELEVRNPSRKHPIIYREFEVSVSYYCDEILSMTKMAPFHQSPKNQTKLIAEPKALMQSLGDQLVGYAIRQDFYGDGIVSFDVNVRLQFEYEKEFESPNDQNEKTRTKRIGKDNFRCGDVDVRYPPDDKWSSGIMLGGSKRCDYYRSN